MNSDILFCGLRCQSLLRIYVLIPGCHVIDDSKMNTLFDICLTVTILQDTRIHKTEFYKSITENSVVPWL